MTSCRLLFGQFELLLELGERRAFWPRANGGEHVERMAC